jgi:hypothetical protein
MQGLPLIPLLGALLWIIACSIIAAAVLLRSKRNGLSQEHAFFVGGMVFLALAPSMSLLTYVMSEAQTIFGGSVHLLVAAVFFTAAFRARRQRLDANAARSGMTFREKSAALISATLCLVFVSYFARTWNATFDAAVPVFIGSIVLIVVIMIIGHIVIALLHSPLDEVEAASDERDRQIELHSVRNAYYALAVGIWIVLVLAVSSARPMVIANTALAVVVLAEVVKYGSLLGYYRFGAINA